MRFVVPADAQTALIEPLGRMPRHQASAVAVAVDVVDDDDAAEPKLFIDDDDEGAAPPTDDRIPFVGCEAA